MLGYDPAKCTTCFTTTFPRIMGGTSSYTGYTAIDVDSTSGDIVVGGTSADTEVITDSNTPVPFILYITYGNFYQWAVQVTAIDFDYVSSVKFNTDATSVAVAFDY